MKKDWLTNGISAAGFDWHGPQDPLQRPAVVDPQQKNKQIWYLELALERSRSIARVKFPNGGFATCFLVGPNLILTNNHVFETPDDTQGVKIQFDYRETFLGDLTDPVEFDPDPAIFITDAQLDFTLVSLSSEVTDRDYLRVRHGQQPQANSHISIIQHPGGQPLQVAMRDNSLVFQDDAGIEYLTNTDYGSSGSPVFNDNWQVIGLHSQRVKDPGISGKVVWYRNRGSKITRILQNAQVAHSIPAA